MQPHFNRRRFLQTSSATLASFSAMSGFASASKNIDTSPFATIYDAYKPHMRLLYEGAKATHDGRALLRPCVNEHYNGLWHDDFTWPLIGMPELQQEPELADVIPWLTDAMVDLPVVADRIEFDGTAVMSPGGVGQPPMSEGMPLHLPSAWVRLLSYADAAGIEIPHKDRWARLLKRSFEEVFFSFGLVNSDTQRTVVGFGFHDSIRLAGLDLMTSLVTHRGLLRTLELFDNELDDETKEDYQRKAQGIVENLHRLFDPELGGFVGASRIGRAFSVWGNGMAWGLAKDEQKETIAQTMREHQDTIFYLGCTRQLPGTAGWPGTNREVSYQNGGYWATGTGFVLPMLAEIDASWAQAIAQDLLDRFESISYCEWIDKQDARAVPNFLGSVSMPMMGLRAIHEERTLLSYM